MQDEEEETVRIPTEATPPEPEVEEEPKDELADLFEVPQPEDNDMETDDLFEVTEKDIVDGDGLSEEEEKELSDLVDVSQEDIMGEPEPEREKVQPKYRVAKRPIRREPPPTSLGGIRS